jgi:GH15 family glucan-1,4-alpha-glucosidase
MCWTGIDRGIRIAHQLRIKDVDFKRWEKIKGDIKQDILENGYDDKLGSFVAYYGSQALDTSTLNIPIVGLLPVKDHRVISTLEKVMNTLTIDWFVLRTSDTQNKLQEGEGTKKRFIFFNKELIETKITLAENEDPMLGLDEFGDIVIKHDQLPVIRGGWSDRYNTYYQEYPTKGQPSSLSIYFKEKIDRTLNTNVQTANRKKLT